MRRREHPFRASIGAYRFPDRKVKHGSTQIAGMDVNSGIVEQGDYSEASLVVTSDAIAEKSIRYYWRQAMP